MRLPLWCGEGTKAEQLCSGPTPRPHDPLPGPWRPSPAGPSGRRPRDSSAPRGGPGGQSPKLRPGLEPRAGLPALRALERRLGRPRLVQSSGRSVGGEPAEAWTAIQNPCPSRYCSANKQTGNHFNFFPPLPADYHNLSFDFK